MVTTRSQSKLFQSQTKMAQGPRTIPISFASYEASLPYKKRKIILDLAKGLKGDEVPLEEQDDEIKLAAVCANLNNRITELSEQYGMLYKIYLTERKKRQYYEHLCRNYETNIHAHNYLE